ncbi:DUF4304 domain-containing protein [Candidatus Clostridium radicumherbarum]|uniref:DUF4304 domain-containing protein n=1 Tax=Candidatus Clostridium radicumherbarum TaxID=3381662 RepID=A0ABW8TXM8_9CLOT
MDDFSYGSPYLDSLSEKYNYAHMLHETFDNVIVPGFKGRGFRKNGKTLYRQRDGLIEVCHVKFSCDNSSVHARFWLQVGIAIPSFYDSLGKKYEKKWETTIFNMEPDSLIGWENGLANFHCSPYMLDLWNSRLLPFSLNETRKDEKKELLKGKLDNRYNKQTGEGFNKVVASDIENVIIKFFSTIPSAEKLLEHIDNDEPNTFADEVMMYEVAHLYYNYGKQEKAKEILRRIQNGFLKEEIQRYIDYAGIVL